MGRSAALVHSRKSPLSRIESAASSCHHHQEEQGRRTGMTWHRYKNPGVGNIAVTKNVKTKGLHIPSSGYHLAALSSTSPLCQRICRGHQDIDDPKGRVPRSPYQKKREVRRSLCAEFESWFEEEEDVH